MAGRSDERGPTEDAQRWIGAFVASKREEHGLRQVDFAKIAGINVATLSRFEGAKVTWELTTLWQILLALYKISEGTIDPETLLFQFLKKSGYRVPQQPDEPPEDVLALARRLAKMFPNDERRIEVTHTINEWLNDAARWDRQGLALSPAPSHQSAPNDVDEVAFSDLVAMWARQNPDEIRRVLEGAARHDREDTATSVES